MKKKVKIIISVVVLVLLLGLVSWFTIPSFSLSKSVNPDKFYSEWMKTIKDDTKINEVVIPGSHDAGTNGMMPQARTQGHDIIDQLKSGARYFDIRVTNKKDDLVIFHGPIKGQKFTKVLDDINSFISQNPSEFIILDFQHLGDNHAPIIDAIKSNLDPNKTLKPSLYSDVSKVSFKTLRDNKINFMIVWSSKNEEEKLEAKNNDFYIRDNALISEYNGPKHKESGEALIKEFDNYYSLYESNKCFVLQAQRTAKTLLGRPSIYEKNFNKLVNEFIISLNEDKVKLNKTNIIMRDFIASDITKVNLILKLNITKDLVKEEYKNLYNFN